LGRSDLLAWRRDHPRTARRSAGLDEVVWA